MRSRASGWILGVAAAAALMAAEAVEAQSGWQLHVGTGATMAPTTRLGEDAGLHAGVHVLRGGGERFFGVDFARAELELGAVDALSLSGARYLHGNRDRRYYVVGGVDVARIGMDHVTPVLGFGVRLETLRLPVYTEVRLRVTDDLGRESALAVVAGVVW